MIFKSLYKLFLVFTGAVLVFTLIANLWVVYSTKGEVYNDMERVPDHKVALVLGTSKKLVGGMPNPFFDNRIKAAADLYHHGKVKHFILSGDNRTKYYNEPVDMKKALVEKGVPESAITLDYAGLRTLDSVVRCKEIFGQDSIIIITQQFHSYRALFLSDFFKLNASVYSADDVTASGSFKVVLREFFARPKAVIDLYLINTQPKYLGDEEKIVI